MTNNQVFFLQLVRLGIGVSGETANPLKMSWDIKALAEKQGLLDIVLDGIEKLPEPLHPNEELLLSWIGALMNDERHYDIMWKTGCNLSSLFAHNGIRTYVLKGSVVSECYPNPKHRVSVDLDCFLLPSSGNSDVWEKGNALVLEAGYRVNKDFYKNSTFYLPGLVVESHKFLTPFRGNVKLKKLEILLQDMLRNDEGKDRFEGTDLFRPPVMVSSLFLIEHAYSHFLHEGLTWKHVLDWFLFIRKHNNEINWAQFNRWIKEFGFETFYDSFIRMGDLLFGKISEDALTKTDRMMLADIWSELDVHESVTGVRGKLALVGNTWRARWKYRYFTDTSWIISLWIQVKGFLFVKKPELY